ncbi:hypothetical protein GCM10022226_74230 [Sphaerisporangium flaviroseum]|uniref:CHAT domain-containing protein n=1 Tax=Sphaerisporangium flaviroseum TaxID=509199 RepID=A0ABP7JCZ4_9ACTN
MLRSTDLLVSLLLSEQHRNDLSLYLGPDGQVAALASLPDEERPLAVSAAAIAAGRPKHALRVLEGVTGSREVVEVASALRVAARTNDLNLFPGGAGQALPQAVPVAGEVPTPVDPGADLVVLVAARMIPLVQSARSMAEDALMGDSIGAIAQVYRWFDELGARFAALDAPGVLCYHWLALADVARRAGRVADSAGPLEAGRELAGDDPVALAHLNLVQGDWALTPVSHPEIMGLSLTGRGPAVAVPAADPSRAAEFYARAEELYAAAGFGGGAAAVALRRAHLARSAGDAAACEIARERARELAGLSGEDAMARVLDVHAILDRLGSGEDVPRREVDAVAAWSRAEGGDGLARGLVRLMLAAASKQREGGASPPVMRALRLARHLAAGVDAPAEKDLADRAFIDFVSDTNFRSASAALLAGETAQAVAALGEGPVDVLAWVRAVEQAIYLDRMAEGGADPDLKGLAAARLQEVEAAFARIPDPPAVLAPLAGDVRDAARQARPLVLRYQARRAEQAGFADDALALLRRALDLTDQPHDALLRAVLLCESGRKEEGRALALQMVQDGSLPDDLAVDLFLRLGDPQTAKEALDRYDTRPPVIPVDRPWTDLSRRAELAEALGDHDTAADLSGRAITEFERRAAQLVQETLRTSLTDDVAVAGMYHTGILALLGQAGDASGTGERVKLAFELSDRCRGLVVEVLEALDDLSPGAARDAVRRWLRAGSAWAAAYEGLVEEVTRDPERTPAPEELRRRVLDAEEELEEAESQVTRLAPALLTGRRGTRPGAGFEEVQAGLGEDRVLVAYESFGDDLVIWAADRERMRHRRLPARERDLASRVRRFHTECSTGGLSPDSGAELAELLLGPARQMIGEREHLVIVPHRALALLPFHALPWDGQVLGDRTVVSLLPSAALLTRPQADRRPRLDSPALLVGDPAYAPGRGLPGLPGTATEVATIARMLGTTDPLTGAAATEEAVARQAPGRPVVHLATHGLVYERAPHRSFVALAGDDLLTVGDVMGLNLAADLVVLSACHTGRGTATAAGDVVGLVRAALTAGARHVVVSLWPVHDEAGCLLMTGMYARLVAGEGVAQALTGARREVRAMDAAARSAAYERLRQEAGTDPAAGDSRDIPAQGPPPDREGRSSFYWAPFVHVGA